MNALLCETGVDWIVMQCSSVSDIDRVSVPASCACASAILKALLPYLLPYLSVPFINVVL